MSKVKLLLCGVLGWSRTLLAVRVFYAETILAGGDKKVSKIIISSLGSRSLKLCVYALNSALVYALFLRSLYCLQFFSVRVLSLVLKIKYRTFLPLAI